MANNRYKIVLILCASFLFASNEAIAIPIHDSISLYETESLDIASYGSIPTYDIGDYISGYGSVIGINITELVDGITVSRGATSGPSLLFSETRVVNGILVEDLIVEYYYGFFGGGGVPEPSIVALILIGLPFLMFRKYLHRKLSVESS